MDIKGYEGIYKVYEDGRVWSYRRDIFLKPTITNRGYPSVLLSVASKQNRFLVHRLVALSFIPVVANKPFINHKDGNKLNCDYTNLEWCTPPENSKHALENGLHQPSGKRILARDYVQEIRSSYLNGESTQALAIRLGFHIVTVRDIVFGRKYKKLYPELISTWQSKKPEHGTHSRYCKGCRCQSCKEAHRKANKLYRQQLLN
jgi:hypothetical protein